eukprot:6750943-Prymnesium_polylepis.1
MQFDPGRFEPGTSYPPSPPPSPLPPPSPPPCLDSLHIHRLFHIHRHRRPYHKRRAGQCTCPARRVSSY